MRRGAERIKNGDMHGEQALATAVVSGAASYFGGLAAGAMGSPLSTQGLGATMQNSIEQGLVKSMLSTSISTLGAYGQYQAYGNNQYVAMQNVDMGTLGGLLGGMGNSAISGAIAYEKNLAAWSDPKNEKAAGVLLSNMSDAEKAAALGVKPEQVAAMRASLDVAMQEMGREAQRNGQRHSAADSLMGMGYMLDERRRMEAQQSVTAKNFNLNDATYLARAMAQSLVKSDAEGGEMFAKMQTDLQNLAEEGKLSLADVLSVARQYGIDPATVDMNAAFGEMSRLQGYDTNKFAREEYQKRINDYMNSRNQGPQSPALLISGLGATGQNDTMQTQQTGWLEKAWSGLKDAFSDALFSLSTANIGTEGARRLVLQYLAGKNGDASQEFPVGLGTVEGWNVLDPRIKSPFGDPNSGGMNIGSPFGDRPGGFHQGVDGGLGQMNLPIPGTVVTRTYGQARNGAGVWMEEGNIVKFGQYPNRVPYAGSDLNDLLQLGAAGLNATGNSVQIKSTFGGADYFMDFMHMVEPASMTGTLQAGTVLGEIGTTGKSTGNHGHFQVFRLTEPTNIPRAYYEPKWGLYFIDPVYFLNHVAAPNLH